MNDCKAIKANKMHMETITKPKSTTVDLQIPFFLFN